MLQHAVNSLRPGSGTVRAYQWLIQIPEETRKITFTLSVRVVTQRA